MTMPNEIATRVLAEAEDAEKCGYSFADVRTPDALALARLVLRYEKILQGIVEARAACHATASTPNDLPSYVYALEEFYQRVDRIESDMKEG